MQRQLLLSPMRVRILVMVGVACALAFVASLTLQARGKAAACRPATPSASARTLVFVESLPPNRRRDVEAPEGEPQPASREVAAAWATAAALASLAPLERQMLRIALEELATRAEARANPFGDDLGDGVPEEALTNAAQLFLPTFTAANALTAGRWASGDGQFVVQAIAKCGADHPSCLRLYEPPPHTPIEKRARFLAWPLASAAVVAAPDTAAASRVAKRLRTSAIRGTSRIALILTGADLRGASDDFDDLRVLARRVLRLTKDSKSPGARALSLLAAPPAQVIGQRAAFLPLGDEEIILVPRMGTLVDSDAFADEVQSSIRPYEGPERVRWVRRPFGLNE